MSLEPKILLIIGPTAVGKSSMIDRAIKDFPVLEDLITYTTRSPRGEETEGNPYHFIAEERFKQLVEDKFFIEWAVVHGKMYGTPRDQVEKAHKSGRVIIADLDVQGAKRVRHEYPNTCTIFLMPPSMDALRQRFIKRGVTSAQDLEKRLESAQRELAQAKDFQYVLINDDFESTYAEVRKIIENLLKNQ
jgi:guanylate kinase